MISRLIIHTVQMCFLTSCLICNVPYQSIIINWQISSCPAIPSTCLFSGAFEQGEKKKHKTKTLPPNNDSNACILLMEEIMQQFNSLSHHLPGFIHSKWCRICSINRMSICIYVPISRPRYCYLNAPIQWNESAPN